MTRSSTHRHGAARASTAVLAVGLLLGACTTEPEPDPAPTQTTSEADLPDNDADVEALDARVADLRATVGALRTSLEDVVDGNAGSLDRAAGLLAADVEAASTPRPSEAPENPTTPPDEGATIAPGELAPLLPGPDVSRSETVSYGDLLTRTLGAARGAGSAGEGVARFLADPLAGDLGSWQRSPADLLDLIARASEATTLDSAGTAILMLDGEAPRALAWVLYGIGHPADASEAATRALAHLTVIETALADIT